MENWEYNAESCIKKIGLEKRNTVDIIGLATTSLRYQVSNSEAAAVATAYVGGLIKNGYLPSDARF